MPLLLESDRTELWRGDILRLPDSGDLGPEGGPADVMVFDPSKEGRGMGLVWVSGHNAGYVWSILPEESERPGARCIDIEWLKRNWDDWFAYEWDWKMRVIDIDRTEILEWHQRTIVEMPTDADRRPS